MNLIILCLLPLVLSLTGSSVASVCYCDLTSSFCDTGCCCDLDCSTTISASCYQQFGASYCPNPTYFARVSETYRTTTGCYYYNTTTTIQDQTSLSRKTIVRILPTPFTPIASTIPTPYTGYSLFQAVTFSGISAFSILQDNGDCGIAGNLGTSTFTVYFGMNSQIRCRWPTGSSTTLPTIFSSFIGKSVPSFASISDPTVQISASSSSAMTSLQLTFLMGRYGSQNMQYIQQIIATSSTVPSNERTLIIAFVPQSAWTLRSSSPSFFPQIPKDMFYPIYLNS